MNATNLDTSEASKHVAADMLKQGEKDLRRSCKGTTPVERELYLDAYYWIVSNDYYSPFSFLNVCQLLGLEPWNKRDELADFSRGAFEYRTRRSGYAARRFHISLSRLFSGELDSSAMESTSLLHVSKREITNNCVENRNSRTEIRNDSDLRCNDFTNYGRVAQIF